MNRNQPLLSRYELKYWLSPQTLPKLRRHVQPYCRPDSHSSGRPGNRYLVGSLYLDNRDFDLYQATVDGHSNRFKLRVRSYDDNPDSPVFFEVKKRVNKVVLKRRAEVPRSVAEKFLTGQSVPSVDPAFEEFAEACRSMGAGPTLRVRYEREAYESRANDSVRITIDFNVMHAITDGPDLSLNGPGWMQTPNEGAILEIKFDGTPPAWVTEMVRTLDLKRTSVAKYVRSLDRAFAARGKAPWSSPMGEQS